jgi:hypothetical protein
MGNGLSSGLHGQGRNCLDLHLGWSGLFFLDWFRSRRGSWLLLWFGGLLNNLRCRLWLGRLIRRKSGVYGGFIIPGWSLSSGDFFPNSRYGLWLRGWGFRCGGGRLWSGGRDGGGRLRRRWLLLG